MVDEARLQNVLKELNELLGDVTPYKLAVVPPSEIRPVDKNAHFMPKRVWDSLRANVEKDGNLSSLPFCWRHPDGTYESMSGNHRVKVAAETGVSHILTLYTDEALSKPERLAIQLSHNALVGQENFTTLRELWEEIDDLSLRVYTGLDEQYLETMAPVNIQRINEAALRFEEVTLMFIPAEVERIKNVVPLLGKATRHRFAGRLQEWDSFFEMLLTFKEAAGIVNTSTAFLAIIDIVEEWIAEHPPEDETAEAGAAAD